MKHRKCIKKSFVYKKKKKKLYVKISELTLEKISLSNETLKMYNKNYKLES